MRKIPTDLPRLLVEGFARSTVEDLSLIADAARRSKIREAEARSLDTGEMILKRGFAVLIEILAPLQNSKSQIVEKANFALQDLMLGAYIIGSRGNTDETNIIDGFAVSAGRAGGQNSGRSRSADADDRWQNDAKKIAREEREKDDSLSQVALAEIIRRKFNYLGPSAIWIKQRISAWENDGSLTPSKKKRKKRA
jgi:hypothetical protein